MCAGPPPGSGTPFIPNVFCGTSYNEGFVIDVPSGRFPSQSLGTSDFSMEFWLNFWGNSDPGSPDDHWDIGWPADRTTPSSFDHEIAMVAFLNWSPQVVVDDLLGGGPIIGGFLPVPTAGWHYWAINFDRSALCSIFIDGELVHSFDISGVAGSMGSRIFVPSGMNAGDQGPPDFPGSYVGDAYVGGGVGPIATHVGGSAPLLTADNMAEAMRCRDVNFFDDGDELIYRWTNIEFDEGPEWEFDREKIWFFMSELPPIPIAAPVGPDESVRCRSQGTSSGLADSIRFQTVARYGKRDTFVPTTPELDMQAWSCFGSDPFFSTGGGVPPSLGT